MVVERDESCWCSIIQYAEIYPLYLQIVYNVSTRVNEFRSCNFVLGASDSHRSGKILFQQNNIPTTFPFPPSQPPLPYHPIYLKLYIALLRVLCPVSGCLTVQLETWIYLKKAVFKDCFIDCSAQRIGRAEEAASQGMFCSATSYIRPGPMLWNFKLNLFRSFQSFREAACHDTARGCRFTIN